MKQRVVTGGFIVYNGKFLIVKRAPDETFYPNVWEIPGGKLEFGEKPEDGARREIFEEVGLKVKLISPISTWTYPNPHNDTQYVQIDYLCEAENDEVKLSEEHSEFAWITFNELENYNISVEMKEELLKIQSHPLVN